MSQQLPAPPRFDIPLVDGKAGQPSDYFRKSLQLLYAAVTNIWTAPVVPSSKFANLPAHPQVGQRFVVTDSTVNTWGSTIAGTGGNTVLAWWNGSNWTVTGA